jgi:hypothetical protein
MTKNHEDRFPYEQAWHGVLDPSLLDDDVVAAGHQLADAAKQGDWSTVFILLGNPTAPVRVNGWRPGGKALFTVLHQAAWHGASADVAAELIRLGALRTLTEPLEKHSASYCAGRFAELALRQPPRASNTRLPGPHDTPDTTDADRAREVARRVAPAARRMRSPLGELSLDDASGDRFTIGLVEDPQREDLGDGLTLQLGVGGPGHGKQVCTRYRCNRGVRRSCALTRR